MAANKFGRVVAKGLGIDVDAHKRMVPDDLVDRASAALYPHEPYVESLPTTKEWLANHTPSIHDILPYLVSFFPFTKWLGRYNVRWLVGDLIAGITLGLVVVPQALSYALLANLSPEYGLYTSFTGAALYWLFGTSKDIAIGATAVVSLLVGKTGDAVLEKHPNFSREEIAKTHAFIAGCILLVFGLLRLDWLIEFIPHVAISAFITGAAITISLSQLPTLLGITGINSKGPAYQVFIDVCKGLPRTKVDAAVGITALVLLSFIKWLCEYLTKKRPQHTRVWSTISSLRLTFTILLYTLVSFLVNRTLEQDQSKFRILGNLPRGFSHAGPPTLDGDLISALLPELPATVIILIIEHIAIGKSFGRVNGYTVIPSQELISIAATNLTGPFVGAYASTGSFGGTAILSKAGVRTPLAGVFNGVVLVLALYALTAVLYYIPMASLSALIIHAVINLVTSPDHLYRTWRVSPPDVVIFAVGVLVAVFTSLEDGIYATVALSAVLLLLRLARAQGRFLGRVRVHQHAGVKPGSGPTKDDDDMFRFAGFTPMQQQQQTDHSGSPSTQPEQQRDAFLPLDRQDASNPAVHVEAPQPGVFIYRFTEGFNYLNQAQYVDTLLAHVMRETRRTTVTHYENPGDRPWNDPAPTPSKSPPADVVSNAESVRPTLQAIILDCSAVHHLDSGAVEGLLDLRAQLDRWARPDPVQWHFAHLDGPWARRALAEAGFGVPARGEMAGWAPAFAVAGKGREMGGEGYGVGEGARERRGSLGQAEKGLPVVDVPARTSSNMAAVHGVNRPNFHVDVAAAMVCVESHSQSRARERGGVVGGGHGQENEKKKMMMVVGDGLDSSGSSTAGG
ncbi:sulfate permease [Xylariomycetidae sp. FL0641]|nr:sulfate permease [Xylariomycetidae sp. FL0641]